MRPDEFEFAYLDESGDSGAKGSKYLILCLICTSKKKAICRIIREAKRTLLRKNKTARWLNRMGGEIKFSGFPDKKLLIEILKKLNKINIYLYFFAILKEGKSVEKDIKKLILTELIRHIFQREGHLTHKIIADIDYFDNKKIEYFVIKEVRNVIVENINKDSKEIKENKKQINFDAIDGEEFEKIKEGIKIGIRIEHHNSQLSEELQALDILSGAIFRKFENNDPTYFDILKDGNLKVNGKDITLFRE